MNAAHNRPNFGSDSAIAAWQTECNAISSTMTSEYALAPRCTIMRADGRMLRQAGEPVTVADFEPMVTPTGVIHPLAQLDRAVRDGAVLRRGRLYPVQDGPGPRGDGPIAA